MYFLIVTQDSCPSHKVSQLSRRQLKLLTEHLKYKNPCFQYSVYQIQFIFKLHNASPVNYIVSKVTLQKYVNFLLYRGWTYLKMPSFYCLETNNAQFTLCRDHYSNYLMFALQKCPKISSCSPGSIHDTKYLAEILLEAHFFVLQPIRSCRKHRYQHTVVSCRFQKEQKYSERSLKSVWGLKKNTLKCQRALAAGSSMVSNASKTAEELTALHTANWSCPLASCPLEQAALTRLLTYSKIPVFHPCTLPGIHQCSHQIRFFFSSLMKSIWSLRGTPDVEQWSLRPYFAFCCLSARKGGREFKPGLTDEAGLLCAQVHLASGLHHDQDWPKMDIPWHGKCDAARSISTVTILPFLPLYNLFCRKSLLCTHGNTFANLAEHILNMQLQT